MPWDQGRTETFTILRQNFSNVPLGGASDTFADFIISYKSEKSENLYLGFEQNKKYIF
jgi:hypothetical protein